MARGTIRYIDYKGEKITIPELCRRENRSYSTVNAKLRINPDATWQELVALRNKFLVVVDGRIMDTTSAGKILKISRGNVIDRWRKLIKGEISMADYNHIGPRLNQHKKERVKNQEWIELGKNKKNGPKAQRIAKLNSIPENGIFDGKFHYKEFPRGPEIRI